MKSLYLGFALLLSGVMLHSCRKNDKFTPTLTVDKTTLNATAEAGKAYLEITSNTEWTLSGIPEWLEVNPKSGKGDARIEVSYPANSTVNAKQATLSLGAADVSSIAIAFQQMGTAPSLLADKTTIAVIAAGKEEPLVVTSNVAWTLSGLPAWITADKTSGPAGVTNVKLTVAANSTIASRKLNLTLGSTVSGVSPVSIEISQAQQDVTITTFTSHAKGGETITITGSGFAGTTDRNTVIINGITAAVTAASSTSLSVTVPVKAGNGKIQVTAGEKNATSASDFVYDWAWMVSDIAGAGMAGITFSNPLGVAIAPNGNVFVADMTAHAIFKIETNASGVSTGSVFAGSTTSSAGSTNGQGTAARFYTPVRLRFDESGTLYVADRDNNAIRKITSDGLVSTVLATVSQPNGVLVDKAGNIYVSELFENRIIQIAPDNSKKVYIQNQAGNIYFDGPSGMGADNKNNFYIGNRFTNKVAISTFPQSGGGWSWGTLAGTGAEGSNNGKGESATFNIPFDVDADNDGNVYVIDAGNFLIRKIVVNGSDIQVSTFAGGGTDPGNGPLSNAKFGSIGGIAVSRDGKEMYIIETGSKKLRKIAYQ